MSEHPAVEFLQRAHERAEGLVRVISYGGYEPQTWHIEPSRSRRWVQIFSKSRTLGEPREAAMRDDDQPVMLVQSGRNEHLHAVMHDPAAVMRRVAADRQILAEHANDYGDCAVCACPSEETNGRGAAFHEPLPWPCRTVLLLAEAWGWTEEAT